MPRIERLSAAQSILMFAFWGENGSPAVYQTEGYNIVFINFGNVHWRGLQNLHVILRFKQT